MRGTFIFFRRSIALRRFIPAYAGNINSATSVPAFPPVHPRVCGEHRRKAAATELRDGSSPRMRGTLALADIVDYATRFIPAYAGNISEYRSSASCRPVHPRVCGEHFFFFPLFSLDGGSSPRMRGTSDGCRALSRFWRFIPAYAGNILAFDRVSRSFTVHPRVCGEHRRALRRIALTHGSSPRMRGTSQPGAELGQPPRFIPAYAGNILST